MPRRCHLTGTHSHSGQNVSHSNRKSKRRFEPNLQHAHLHSDALGRARSAPSRSAADSTPT
jgi:ribosomal protein L28